MLTTVWVLANNGKMTGIVLTMDTVRVESIASFSTRGRAKAKAKCMVSVVT
jgi:hypothetical protein